MRLLILGGTGMLGHKMFQYARSVETDVWCTIRGAFSGSGLERVIDAGAARSVIPQVDVMDWDRLQATLEDLRPEVVVNCVGVVKQRPEARAAIPSITINALLPHRVSAAVARWGGRLVHISTDCVFSGRRGSYKEEDDADATDLYGRSKLLGEVSDVNAITLRTSMIGRELREHRSLLDWLLRQDGGAVRGFRRAIYSGLTTNELARVIWMVIERHPTLSGVFHVAGDPISKYDLLRLVVSTFGLHIQVDADDDFVCDRSLIGDRFREGTGYRSPGWPELVADLHRDPTPYEKLAEAR